MSTVDKKFLSTKDLANLFGVNPMTIYRKAKSGDLPAIKFGKNWLFSKEAIDKWIAEKSAVVRKVPAMEAALEKFSRIKPLILVYHFGSSASKTATPLSDIDIAYLDDESSNPFDFEIDIESCARGLFQKNTRIDLVRLNSAPVAVKYKTIKTGRLLYERSEEIRAKFEESVIMEYLDYEPSLAKFYREAA